MSNTPTCFLETKGGNRQTRFEFATATRILFGQGVLRQAGSLAAEMGRRPFVVTGRSVTRAAPLLNELTKSGTEYVKFSVDSEPTVAVVREGTKRALEAECDSVVGFGGGSALDTGKVVAALLTNGGEPEDYLEVVGKGKQLTRPSAPYVAVPTTAGTGAEVTRNAVLVSPEQGVKVSLRSPLMLPRLALVDPELTYSLPPEATASTGLDALTQLVEPYVSIRCNPITDTLCREGMRRAARSLRRAYERGDDEAAREDMMLASLFGGLALANAGLGAVHGFAGPVGGMFTAPHGVICARLLPHVIAINVSALRKRSPQSEALRRYDEIGRILTRSTEATAEDAVAWTEATCGALRVPSLASYGITLDDLPAIIERATTASSMKSNPVELTPDEMRQVLERAL